MKIESPTSHKLFTIPFCVHFMLEKVRGLAALIDKGGFHLHTTGFEL
jgi:hypothetical protein